VEDNVSDGLEGDVLSKEEIQVNREFICRRSCDNHTSLNFATKSRKENIIKRRNKNNRWQKRREHNLWRYSKAKQQDKKKEDPPSIS